MVRIWKFSPIWSILVLIGQAQNFPFPGARSELSSKISIFLDLEPSSPRKIITHLSPSQAKLGFWLCLRSEPSRASPAQAFWLEPAPARASSVHSVHLLQWMYWESFMAIQYWPGPGLWVHFISVSDVVVLLVMLQIGAKDIRVINMNNYRDICRE